MFHWLFILRRAWLKSDFQAGSFIRSIIDHMIEQKHIWSDKICLLDHLNRTKNFPNLLPSYCSLMNTHFDLTKWYLIEQKLSVQSSWSALKFPYKWPWIGRWQSLKANKENVLRIALVNSVTACKNHLTASAIFS